MIPALMLTSCVFTLYHFMQAAKEHGIRIGMRRHAEVCRCSPCAKWIADLKRRGTYRLFLDDKDEHKEE